MKIDFDKVASHFASDRLGELLQQNQQDVSNNKLGINAQIIDNLAVTEPSSILNNNNNSQVNNYKLQQLSALRRTSKEISNDNNNLEFTSYVNQFNNTKHFEGNVQNTSSNNNNVNAF